MKLRIKAQYTAADADMEKQIEALFEWVKTHLSKLNNLLKQPYGENKVETLLAEQAPLSELADLHSPLVIQYLQKTLTPVTFKQQVKKMMNTPAARKITED